MWTLSPLATLLLLGAPTSTGPQEAASRPLVGGSSLLSLPPLAQEAYLKASNAGAFDNFSSVAVSGNTVVVGAWDEDSAAAGVDGDEDDDSLLDAGAAYVFVRTGAGWVQEAYLKPSDPQENGHFGSGVAISGETIVVGAPGVAYVFVRNGGTWGEQARLEASNAETGDGFGTVDISGDTIVVGAYLEDSSATGVNGDEDDNTARDSGAAYVFVRNGSTWSQQAYLKASNTEKDDLFGTSVAVSGDTIVVSATGEDSRARGVDGDETDNTAPLSGAAYVFTRIGSSWSQQAYLKASNTGASDYFGWSTAVSGETLVISAIRESSSSAGVNGIEDDDSMQWAGAAYVFVRPGSTWSQEAYLKASNPGDYDWFGQGVALSGDAIVVGTYAEDSNATGVDGDGNNDGRVNSGAAYVFLRDGSTWSQSAYLKASNSNSGDSFGGFVAAADSTIVVGSFGEDSAANRVNGDQSDNSLFDAGAAYVFDLDPDELGVRYCDPAVPNSSGMPGVVHVYGNPSVTADYLVLLANDLPASSNIGYFLMGTGQNSFTPPGSSGPICVAPAIRRYLPPVENTTQLAGGFRRDVGTSGHVSGAITAGSTWNFQAWHRDGANPSNLTDAVGVVFN